MASTSDGGTCTHIAVNNTLYNNVKQAYATTSGDLAVCEIGVQELVTDICGEIRSGAISVLYTAAHPNLGGASITIKGNGISGNTVLASPAPPVPVDLHGSVPYSVAGLPSCAYILTLQVDVLLTDGVGDPDPIYDQIAFCKS